MENSVGFDQMPRSVASDLGLNCLLRSTCPNTKGKYGSRQKVSLSCENVDG